MRRAERDDETDAIVRQEFGRARYKLVRAMRPTRILIIVGWVLSVLSGAGSALALWEPGWRVIGAIGVVGTCCQIAVTRRNHATLRGQQDALQQLNDAEVKHE